MEDERGIDCGGGLRQIGGMKANNRHEAVALGAHIVVDPRVCHGKPTFEGTRVMVFRVLEQVGDSRWQNGERVLTKTLLLQAAAAAAPREPVLPAHDLIHWNRGGAWFRVHGLLRARAPGTAARYGIRAGSPARIFHTHRRVRARGLQGRGRSLVGRVPSRGALLPFPSEYEICGLEPEVPLVEGVFLPGEQGDLAGGDWGERRGGVPGFA